jgi:Single Cache domain 2
MIRNVMIIALVGVAIAVATTALAQSKFGTAAEAKAMLEKTVIGMKADPAKTIAQINKGEGGFKDRDLYPVCIGSDGKFVAHTIPERIGLVVKDIKDVTGKAYGEEFIKVAAEGKFAEVSYMFPRPGDDKTPVQKVSFVTKVGDYICLVGYYK